MRGVSNASPLIFFSALKAGEAISQTSDTNQVSAERRCFAVSDTTADALSCAMSAPPETAVTPPDRLPANSKPPTRAAALILRYIIILFR